jgi:pilus assembly protein Flp/PilA
MRRQRHEAPPRTAGFGRRCALRGDFQPQEIGMKHLLNGVMRFLRDEEGANGVEYALLAGLIAVAFIVGASALGTNLNTFFGQLAACVAAPSTACNPFGGA